MLPATVRTIGGADVRGRGRDLEAGFAQPIVDHYVDHERVTGHRVDACTEHDTVTAGLDLSPCPPSQQPVDGVALVRLVQRRLTFDAVEGASAVIEAVRPRHQHCAM